MKFRTKEAIKIGELYTAKRESPFFPNGFFQIRTLYKIYGFGGHAWRGVVVSEVYKGAELIFFEKNISEL